MQNRFLKRKTCYRWMSMTSILMFICIGLLSCSGYDLDKITPSWLKSNIYDYLSTEGTGDGKYTNFVKLIDDLGYKDVLAKTGSKTLFVANDSAFNRFYANNAWSVKSYSGLSVAQKKMLLYGAMINNSFQIDMLSSTTGPVLGDCMRRLTASSVYDSVPLINLSEMPDNPYWTFYRNNSRNIVCMKDMTISPMIHFIEGFLSTKAITNDDCDFLFNYKTTRQPGDACINGDIVETKNIKCSNGFVNKMTDVMTPLNNMAEAIRVDPNMSEYSKFVERFCAPYYSQTATDNYNRLNGTTVDSVYQKRYFSLRSQGGQPLDLTPVGGAVNGQLKFDPGWNTYYSSTVSSTATTTAMQEDMGVMLVPTNAALDNWWNNQGGKVLKNYYHTKDNVPDNVITKLINNNMLNSFVISVPSKFSQDVLDDASNVMGLTKGDIDSVILCNNGAIYMTNKVFSPTAYSSVSFPALINDNMNILYWGIDQLEYYAYLNSMDSYYSFFIPDNNALLQYIDPVSFGMPTTHIFRFYYNAAAKTTSAKVWASIYNYDTTTETVLDSVGTATSAQILDRMKDILDYHIIVGNVEDGNTYYKTKGGGTIKVSNAGAGNMTVSGGYEIENGDTRKVSDIYDESASGNGKTYILDDGPMLTSRKSVYDILNGHPEFSEFLNLLQGSGYFETVRDATYGCGSTNLSLFNTYNYTVYVPTNASLLALEAIGTLPTWDQVDAATANANTTLADSLTTIIRNFVKYHIQDNSVYIGDGSSSKGTLAYETAVINPSTGRFYKLNVTNNNEKGISITDGFGNTRHVVTGDASLYNLMAREYQYDTKDASKATVFETSSYAVVHLIDGPLLH